MSWNDKRKELMFYLDKGDTKNFIRWPVIMSTMFSNCHRSELHYLQNQKQWPNIKEAIKEHSAGNPPRCKFYTDSSTNLIHHAFSLYLFLNRSGIDIKKLNNIYEFGGGYGSLCRLIYNLGFNGTYTIYDFPEMNKLQHIFLSEVLPGRNIILTNKIYPGHYDLFIGLWSLSESTVETRDNIIKNIKANNYLIGYQGQFNGINNNEYFENISLRVKNKHYLKIRKFKNYNYLIGC